MSVKIDWARTVGLTFAHIPRQVTKAVQRVECKREGNDTLGGIFEPFRNTLNEFDDMGSIQRDANNRSSEIRQKEPIQAYQKT